MVNFIKFKIECIQELLLEISESTQALYKNPDWLKDNAQNKYSYVVNNRVFKIDAEELLTCPSVVILLAESYGLPGATFLLKLHSNYEK